MHATPKALLATIAVAVLGACSNPCTNACSRITRCVDIAELDTTGCRYVCESVQSKLHKRPHGDVQFERFTSCAQDMDYSDRRACGAEFKQCSSHIPPQVWRQALSEAKRLGKGR